MFPDKYTCFAIRQKMVNNAIVTDTSDGEVDKIDEVLFTNIGF